MGGGLMQLVAYGSQDIYLTGNPQITYFKVVYRRHTNFAIESIEQVFSGAAGFGQTVSCTIARNGDLMYWTYVRIMLPEVTPTSTYNYRWLNWLGHVLVQNVTLEIGGQQIDKHYGEWLHIWNELSQKPGQQANYANMVGNVPKMVQPSTSAKPGLELYVPLQFFFCRNPGLALPLIALQYHEVKLTVKFRNKLDCYWSENGIEPSLNTQDFTSSIWVDYIFLDTDERRRFAQVSHEYLIEQLQYNEESVITTSPKVDLTLNHPVKELVWVVQKDVYTNRDQMQVVGGQQYFNYTTKVDTTSFSGTPSDPNGGGIGGGWHSGLNPSLSMPYGGTATLANSGVLTNANRNVANSLVNTANNDINLENLSFSDLFGNGNTTNPVGWNADLPVFDIGKNPVEYAKLQLNGQDRFTERTGRYFNHVQPYQHHTNGPPTGYNLYSFALTPEEHQPSGSCNFSRIDKATLQLTLAAEELQDEAGNPGLSAKVKVYATNYNILRIMSGMGGLAYTS